MRSVPRGSLAEQRKEGRSYFAPVQIIPDADPDHLQRLFDARDLGGRAFELSGWGAEHTAEDYLEAAGLYDQVADILETVAGRSYEAGVARRDAARCREKAARK